MYTLRIIEKDGRISNNNLGNDFSITRKECKCFKDISKLAITNENTYAIIVADTGKIVFPLFYEKKYFIMTESGKTFEKL